MNRLSLVVALVLAGTATSAQSSVLTIGGGYAKSCYEAADGQKITAQGLDACNHALAEEALAQDDLVATHVNRGIVLLRRGSLAEADADFDAALSLDPNQAEAWLNKAILDVRYRHSAGALPLVQKALENGTRNPALAYFVRGVANEDSGNIAAAYHDLQRARALDPNWSEPAIELKRYQVRQP